MIRPRPTKTHKSNYDIEQEVKNINKTVILINAYIIENFCVGKYVLWFRHEKSRAFIAVFYESFTSNFTSLNTDFNTI